MNDEFIKIILEFLKLMSSKDDSTLLNKKIIVKVANNKIG